MPAELRRACSCYCGRQGKPVVCAYAVLHAPLALPVLAHYGVLTTMLHALLLQVLQEAQAQAAGGLSIGGLQVRASALQMRGVFGRFGGCDAAMHAAKGS